MPGELDGPSNKSAPAAEKPALERPPTEPATQQAPAEAPGSRHAATATGLARGPEQSRAGTRQLDEGEIDVRDRRAGRGLGHSGIEPILVAPILVAPDREDEVGEQEGGETESGREAELGRASQRHRAEQT